MADTIYQTETRTDANGQPYDVRIPVTSLTPATPVQIATPTPDTTNHAGIIAGTAEDLKAKADEAQAKVDALNSANSDTANKQSTASEILSIMDQENNKATDTQTAMDNSGATASARRLAGLATEAKNLTLEASAIPLQVQENNKNVGATDAGVAPQSAGALRMNAIKALSISQQANIEQGNYNVAKDIAERMINLKYQPLESKLATLKLQYEFNKDTLSAADAKRATALQAYITKQENDLAEKKALEKSNLDLQNTYVKAAMDGAQSELASQIQSLDTSSQTFKQDLAKFQSQITNPIAKLDIAIKQATLNKLQKETSLLGEPTAAEKKASAAALANAKSSLPAMQDKLATIDAIKNSPGISSRVGTNFLSRKSNTGILGTIGGSLLGAGAGALAGLPFAGVGAIPGAVGGAIAGGVAANAGNIGGMVQDSTGQGQAFAGGVHNLINGLTLQNLIDAKAQGATFGALSEGELHLLASSASKIGDWEVKDSKGNGTGVWNIDQDSFNKELDNIKRLTNRAIALQQGNIMTPDEQSILDNVFSNQDASNFYGN